MITSLRLVNFKNFADETLRVGPFTVIVGTNASGKSNIRDAFRFLHGIGRGYTLSEIFGGKYGPGGQMEWASIRGAINEIVRFGQSSFSLEVGIGRISYSITVGGGKSPGVFRVIKEQLKYRQEMMYTSYPVVVDPFRDQGDDPHLLLRMAKTREQRMYDNPVRVRPDQPALTQLQEHRYIFPPFKRIFEETIRVFASVRFLDLVPDRMRQPAFPGQTVLGDSGENLATVLREICADPQRRETLAAWTRELTPMDVRDFEFPNDPLTGRIQLVVRETNDRAVSAYSASDGTLRFLTTLAALLGKNPAGLYFFEEIDNGIHPSRMRLLIDLIEGQTAKGESQVVTTTHSPDLLSLVNDKTFETTSVVYRDEDSADGIIRPVAELPKARELRQTQGLGRLHTTGWMEDMLAFSEGANQDGENEE